MYKMLLFLLVILGIGACGGEVDSDPLHHHLNAQSFLGVELQASFATSFSIIENKPKKIRKEMVKEFIYFIVGALKQRIIALDPMHINKLIENMSKRRSPGELSRFEMSYNSFAFVSAEQESIKALKIVVPKNPWSMKKQLVNNFATCFADGYQIKNLWYYYKDNSDSCQRLVASADPDAFTTVEITFTPVNKSKKRHSPRYEQTVKIEQQLNIRDIYLLLGSAFDDSLPDDPLGIEFYRLIRLLVEDGWTIQPHLPKPESLPASSAWSGGDSLQAYLVWLLERRDFPQAIAGHRAKEFRFRQNLLKELSHRWLLFEKIQNYNDQSQSKPLGKHRIHLLYADATTPTQQTLSLYKHAFKKGQIIAFNGHSNIGANIFAPKHFESFGFHPGYQLIFLNSCLSYYYFAPNFFSQKPQGRLQLDLIANPLLSDAQGSGQVLYNFVNEVVNESDFLNLLKGLEFAAGSDYKHLRLVDGEYL